MLHRLRSWVMPDGLCWSLCYPWVVFDQQLPVTTQSLCDYPSTSRQALRSGSLSETLFKTTLSPLQDAPWTLGYFFLELRPSEWKCCSCRRYYYNGTDLFNTNLIIKYIHLFYISYPKLKNESHCNSLNQQIKDSQILSLWIHVHLPSKLI
jgi:hypothetical protein